MIATYEEVKDKTIEERDFKGNFAVQYLEKRRGISTTNKPRPKVAKKCGYCRETGHSRRNCSQMEEDKKFIMKANRLWRKIWADRATKYGLTPASLIKVTDRRYDYSQGGYVSNDFLCTVGAELPENLTVFALGEENKKQEIRIPLLGYKPEYGDHTVNARILVNAINEQLAKNLFSYSYSWGNIESVSVVAKSSYEFKDEWFDDCPMEDINYALKKWTKEQMSIFITKCEKLIELYGGDYGIA
tara:strand:- start:312 stop:1043 length:732 start_codon:yes stop_codon:yes gene_type:complete